MAGSLSDSGGEPLLFPVMSQRARSAVPASNATPELVAQLLDVVAEHSVDHALSDIEQVVARLRAGAEEAAVAREALRDAPAEVVREALRLRAAQAGPTQAGAVR